MKVLHIITGLAQGGAERALFLLITNNHNDNFVTHIVVSMVDFGVYGKRLQDAGIQVHMLQMPRGMLTFKGLYKLWSLIRKIKPDIIQTWMYHSDLVGGLIARLAGYNNVIWGIVGFNLNPNVASSSTRLTAKICAMLSGFIPRKIISCSAKSATVHQNMGYAREIFEIIPLGYDLKEFKRNESERYKLRKSYGIGLESIVVGCVARWNPQKDHRNLLQAISIIKDKFSFHCVLAGPGMMENNKDLLDLINSISGLNHNIVLAGIVDSIPNVMSAFDLHILPSLGEAFPNVVAEAMACRTPCIVTDVGDAATIVGNTGWVVPFGNSVALANTMMTALNEMENKEKWKQRTMDCRTRIAENYTIERMVKSYNNLWHLVAAQA